MRQYLAIFILLNACVIPAVSAAELKIAIIDMQEVFDRYWKTPGEQDLLRDEKAKYQDAVDARKEEIKALVQQVNAMRQEMAMLNEDAAKAREQELRAVIGKIGAKRQKLDEYARSEGDRIRQSYEDTRGAILAEIDEELRAYINKQGYDLVLDSSGSTDNRIPLVVHAEPQLDITDDVVAILNAGHEGDMPQPDIDNYEGE